MTTYRIEPRGSEPTCPGNEIPLFADDECIGCYPMHSLAAAAARDLGATEIDCYNIDDPTDGRHALKLKPDGLWCHSFSNI